MRQLCSAAILHDSCKQNTFPGFAYSYIDRPMYLCLRKPVSLREIKSGFLKDHPALAQRCDLAAPYRAPQIRIQSRLIRCCLSRAEHGLVSLSGFLLSDGEQGCALGSVGARFAAVCSCSPLMDTIIT